MLMTDDRLAQPSTSRAFAAWWWATVSAAVADVATTLPGIAHGLPEHNALYPLVLALPLHAPWLWMLLAKVPVLLLLLWCGRTLREFPRACVWLAVGACLYNLALAATNLYAVLHVLHLMPH